jgi:hypothetical protein
LKLFKSNFQNGVFKVFKKIKHILPFKVFKILNGYFLYLFEKENPRSFTCKILPKEPYRLKCIELFRIGLMGQERIPQCLKAYLNFFFKNIYFKEVLKQAHKIPFIINLMSLCGKF